MQALSAAVSRALAHLTHATLADERKDFVRAEFCADPLDAAKFATPAAK